MTSAISSGLAATKNANDLIFGAGASASSVNKVGSGFTSRSGDFGNRTEDKNVTEVGSYDASASQAVANNPWVMHMVAFKVDVNAPDKTPPSTPTGLSQIPKSTSQIDLTWNASTDEGGVAGYKVYRGGSQIATTTTTSYGDTGLAPLTTYGYAVSAFDTAGNSSPKSAVVNATTAADTTAPSVSLTSPADGAPVSGTTNLTATALDDVGVTGLQFLLDGKPLGPEIVTPPYAFSWNTAAATGGSHVLAARARDAANHFTTSAEAKVTVTPPDTSPPTAANHIAYEQAPVSDVINVTAVASDNVGVVGLQFLVDGVNSGQEDTTPPYELPWDSRAVTNGPHTLTARSRDAAGNSTPSAPITVDVANSPSQCGVATGSLPTAIIRSPNQGSLFTAGQVITLNGGTDPDCGALPDSAFSWAIDLIKDGGQTLQSNSINARKNSSFPVPTTGYDFQGDTQYRITLTVTDGESNSTSSITIYPQKVNLTFGTAPPGLVLNFDGADKPTPFTVDTVVGSRHSVEARNQSVGGVSYVFASWSDGKAQQHDLVAPGADQNYTATYTMPPSKPVQPSPPVQPGPITFKQQNYSMPQTLQSIVVTAYTKPQTDRSTNLIAIGWRSAEGRVLSVTDSAGNHYELAAELIPGEGNLSQAIYYAKSIGAAPAGNQGNGDLGRRQAWSRRAHH